MKRLYFIALAALFVNATAHATCTDFTTFASTQAYEDFQKSVSCRNNVDLTISDLDNKQKDCVKKCGTYRPAETAYTVLKWTTYDNCISNFCKVAAAKVNGVTVPGSVAEAEKAAADKKAKQSKTESLALAGTQLAAAAVSINALSKKAKEEKAAEAKAAATKAASEKAVTEAAGVLAKSGGNTTNAGGGSAPSAATPVASEKESNVNSGQATNGGSTVVQPSGNSAGAEQKDANAKADVDVKKVESLGKQIVEDKTSPALRPMDSQGSQDKQNAEAKDSQFTQNLQATMDSVRASLSSLKAACTGPHSAACIQPITSSETELMALMTLANSYKAVQISCSDSAVRADNFCSLIRSPQAQMVQQLMTVGTTLLGAITSASESCGAASKISQMGQLGMAAANVTCTGIKVMCDKSCKSATDTLEKMKQLANKIQSVAPGAARITGLVESEQKTSVVPKVAQCKKHAVDIAQFASQALGLLTASQQAKNCEEQLSASSGDGKGETVADVCKVAANASMQICVCQNNPTAVGCPGGIAESLKANSDKSVVTKTGNGVSSVGAAFNTGKQTSGLSQAAKVALGLSNGNANDNFASDNHPIGGGSAGAGLSSVSGGGLGGGSGNSFDPELSALDKAKGKKGHFGSGFGDGGGGGYYGSGNSKNSDANKTFTDAQLEAAKRKIASDQFQAEVTTSSGRSNWDKIRARYTENRGTLLSGQ